MSFGREVQDFVEGFKTGSDLISKRTDQRAKLAEIEKNRAPTDKDLDAMGNPIGGGGGGAIPSSPSDSYDYSDINIESDPAAAKALGFIRHQEAGSNPYNKLVGGKTADLTNMTIGDVLKYQQQMKAAGHESTALGAYQFINSTLSEAVDKTNMPLDQKFDQATQDKLGYYLLQKRGWNDFKNGKLSKDAFMNNLASEWASLPTASGKSAYAGVGSNAATTSRSLFSSALDFSQPPAQQTAAAAPAAAAPAPEKQTTAGAIPVPAEKPAAQQTSWNQQPPPANQMATYIPPPQNPEEEEQATLFSAEGGVIPEPQYFQAGGEPAVPDPNPDNPSNAAGGGDKYSRFRNYTQQIQPSAGSPSGFTARRVGQAMPGANYAPPMQMTNGMTPSQLAYKQATDKLASDRAAAAAARAQPAAAAPTQDFAAKARAFNAQQQAAYTRAISDPYGVAARGGYGMQFMDPSTGAISKQYLPGNGAVYSHRAEGGMVYPNFAEGGVIPDGAPQPPQEPQMNAPHDPYDSDYWQPAQGTKGYAPGGYIDPAVGLDIPGPPPVITSGIPDPRYPTVAQDQSYLYQNELPGQPAVVAAAQEPPRPIVPDSMKLDIPALAAAPPQPEPSGYPERWRQERAAQAAAAAAETERKRRVMTGEPTYPTVAQDQGAGSSPYPTVAQDQGMAPPVYPTIASDQATPFQQPMPPHSRTPTRGPPSGGLAGQERSTPASSSDQKSTVPVPMPRPTHEAKTDSKSTGSTKKDKTPDKKKPKDYYNDPYEREKERFATRDKHGNLLPARKYAEGGAIPDRNDPYENEKSMFATTQPQPAAPVDQTQTASIPPQSGRDPSLGAASGRKPTPKLLSDVSKAVHGGIKFLTQHFGLEDQGAVPTPDGQQATNDGARRFAAGEGTMTPQEINAIDDKVDPGRQMTEGDRQMVRQAKIVQWYLERGRKEDAAAASAGLMQYGAQRTQQYGSLAAAGYRKYLQTHDPADLQKVTQTLQAAYSMIPNGGDYGVTVNPETHELNVSHTDDQGRVTNEAVSPDQLPGIIKSVQDKSLYWQQIQLLADPEGVHQRDRAAASSAEWDRQHGITSEEEIAKEGRTEQREGRKAEREAAAKEAEHQRNLQEDIAKEGRAGKEHDRQALLAAGIEKAKNEEKDARTKTNWDIVSPLAAEASQAQAGDDKEAKDAALSKLWDSLPEETREKQFAAMTGGLGIADGSFNYTPSVAKAMVAQGDQAPTTYPGQQPGDKVAKGQDKQGNPIWVVTRNGQNFAIPPS